LLDVRAARGEISLRAVDRIICDNAKAYYGIQACSEDEVSGFQGGYAHQLYASFRKNQMQRSATAVDTVIVPVEEIVAVGVQRRKASRGDGQGAQVQQVLALGEVDDAVHAEVDPIEDERVLTGSACQAVVAGAAVQGIRARIAEHAVRVEPAHQVIVPLAAGKIVVTVSADQMVIPLSSGEQVAPGAAIDQVIAVSA
jgi:hypothetical protein